jgi:hypothetical protein
MFINLTLVVMILVAGSIEMDGGPEIDENGWYGQFSVCVFLTCLLWTLHGMFFAHGLRQRNMAPHDVPPGTGEDKNHHHHEQQQQLGQTPYVHFGGGDPSNPANHDKAGSNPANHRSKNNSMSTTGSDQEANQTTTGWSAADV